MRADGLLAAYVHLRLVAAMGEHTAADAMTEARELLAGPTSAARVSRARDRLAAAVQALGEARDARARAAAL